MNNTIYRANAYRSLLSENDGDLGLVFDKVYEGMIDKTKELYLHPKHKDSLVYHLVRHRGNYYHRNIKVVFNSEIARDKAYIREIKNGRNS